MFGTYALSLSFFEAVVLPALRQSGVRSVDVLADLDGVAGALGETGAREVGRTYDLKPVHVRHGVFHPKFMLLDGPEGPSAIVGSGNLTFGGWGHNLELCEVLRPDRSGAALRGMADFLEELGLSDRLTGIDPEALEPWIVRLRAVTPSGDTRVLHSMSAPVAERIVDQATELGDVGRLTIASPYYGGAAAVDGLAAALGSPPVDVHVHDGARLAVNGHHFPFAAGRCGASPVTLGLLDPEASVGPLHAKLIEVECELGTLLVTGSVNASVPALAEARNVELAVVRLVEEPQPRSAAAVPPRSSVEAPEVQDVPSFGILRATMLGTWLKGNVLTTAAPGAWSAEFDHDGTVHDLGVIDVGPDGAFEGEAMLPDASYGRRRSTLTLRRDGAQIRGFVAFPDAIELNIRWGGAIGPMIRVAGGSDDDDDLAGVLEYFASNPCDTASAWRPTRTPHKAREPGVRIVSLSELDARAAADDDVGHSSSSGHRGAFDRILAALRVRWTGAAVREREVRGEHVEVEDGDSVEDGSDARAVRAFDALLEVLAERVPDDPAVELQRAGDIAGFVLLRTPEPRRIAAFAGWWSNLAVRHLGAVEFGAEIRPMAAAMLVLDGLATSAAERTRGRIARVLGDIDEGLGLASAIASDSRLRRLIEIVAGPDAIERFVAEVARSTSAVEEVIIVARHVAQGLAPPPVRLLDGTEEMRTIRRHVAAGNSAKILAVSREAKSCPRCNYALPDAERHRLSSIGMARAGNCCNRVLLAGLD